MHGAVALAQCDDPAEAVTEQLYLDVPGPCHELLEEDARVLEVAGRQPADGFESLRELGIVLSLIHI